MYRDVLTCEECMHCELVERRMDNFNRPDVYKCTRWDRLVGASDYCSKAEKAYPCRLCKYCRPLAENKDKYLCVRERIAYYTTLDYSCSYYEKGEMIKNESKDNESV